MIFSRTLGRLMSQTKTKLTVIMHKSETYTTTNTGRLAHRSLVNSSLFIRGEKNNPLQANEVLDPNYQPLLLHYLQLTAQWQLLIFEKLMRLDR